LAGLAKRKNGIYYLTWREGGRLLRRSTGTRNRREAERARAQFEEERRRGVDDRYTSHRKRPLVEHVEEYHAFQLANGVTQKQADEVRMRVLRVLDTARVRYMSDLTESRIRIAIASLRLKPKTTRMRPEEMPLASPRTRNSYLRSVLQFCNWLVRDRRMQDNPLSSMRAENVQVEIRHEREPLSEDEFALLYETTRNSSETIAGFAPRTRSMIYILGYNVGLRKSEMASLTRESFDLSSDEPTVTVEAAYSKRRRRDTIVLPKEVVPLLDFSGVEDGEPLFPRLSQRKTNVMIRRDLEAAGLAYRTEKGKYRDLHSLRHGYITRVWQAGASPVVARSLARHSDLRETMRYSHVTQDEQRQIVDNLSGIPKLTPPADDEEAA
jgi:integrase